MARPKTFGTQGFGSLVTRTPAYNLEDGQLSQAVNVDRSLNGALTVARADTTLDAYPQVSGETIVGAALLHFGGANHAVVAGTSNIYSDGVAIGGSTGTSPYRFLTDGDYIYAFNGSKNQVFDGTYVRQMGLENYSPVYPAAEHPTVSKVSTTGHDCGLTGTYRYMTTFTFTLGDKTIESNAIYLYKSPITLTSTDQVLVRLALVSNAKRDAIAGVGVGTLRARTYRTKAGGSEFYLIDESDESDIINYRYEFWDSVPDDELVELWLDNFLDHGVPPVATVGVIAQQRLFTNDIANPRNLCFSLNLNRFDYFPNTNAIPVDDTITSLAVMRDNVVIFTPGSIFVYMPVDEISGRLEKSQSPVGTTHADSVVMTENGILFARDDGLWLFDGVTANKVSTPIDPNFSAVAGISDYWRGAYSNKVGYFTNWTNTAISFRMGDNGVEWGTATPVEYVAVSPDPDDNGIYGITGGGVVRKIAASTTLYKTMTVTTQEFGDGTLRQTYRVIADIDAPTACAMTITSNRGDTKTYSFTTDGREVVRRMVPATMIGERFSLTFVMTSGVLYNVRLETV